MLGCLYALAHVRGAVEVSAHIVEEGVGSLHAVLAQQRLAVAAVEAGGLSVDADVEVGKSYLLRILIAGLMEFYLLKYKVY